MRLPNLSRILTENYKDQSKWIAPLLQSINQYFEVINQALSRNLTLGDNLAAAIKTVELDGTYPLKLAWELPMRPVSVIVSNVVRTDGAAFTMADAVQVKWQFNQANQLQIDSVTGGLTIDGSNKFKLTLVCFTG